MDERKRELLKRLETFFAEDEDIEEASLFTKEELKTPMDVLRILITDYGPGLMDVMAECSFLPLEDTEVLFFNTVLTVKMDVPAAGVSALSGAIAKLNFFLPYGGFALSGDGKVLIFKNSVAVPSEDSDDSIYKLMKISTDTSILMAENYSYLLTQVASGDMMLSEFLATLPSAEE